MKSTLILFFVAIISLTVNAQENNPKREFKLGLSATSLELVPGQTTKFDVMIFRSRSYRDKEIQLLVNGLPEGLSIEIDPGKTKQSLAVITLKADDSVTAGKYTLMVQGKSTRVTKGITFSVTVQPKGLSKN